MSLIETQYTDTKKSHRKNFKATEKSAKKFPGQKYNEYFRF